MSNALPAHEIAALRWFAATTFPEATDRAPELAVCRALQVKGLLRPSLGSWEPTEKGDALLAGDRVIVSETRVEHPNYPGAAAIVRVVGRGRGERLRFWTETETEIRSSRFAKTLRFQHSDERSLCRIADRATVLDRLAFDYRAATATAYNATPFRHVST